MKSFFGVIVVMVFVAVLSTRAEDKSSKNASDPCVNVACDRGRMCIADKDSSTVCACPDNCNDVHEPVCSFYNRSYANTCEMHKFACHYGFFTGVKYNGVCTKLDSDNENCPIDRLLGFHERYLNWLQIAYNEEHNVQNKKTNDMNDMSDEERRKLIEYEFASADRDKNDTLDQKEIGKMVDEHEPCMVALLQVCDYDGEPGISHAEWQTCFPSQLEGDIRAYNLALKGRETKLTNEVYCVIGDGSFTPSRIYIWSTIEVKLNFKTERCRLYQAQSREALEAMQSQSIAKRILSWVAEADPIPGNMFHLSPFKNSCFKIVTPEDFVEKDFEVKLTFISFYWKFPLYLIVGLLLFFHAERLSRSATFFYSSGVVLGIGVSLLLVVFVLHRLVPSKAGAYTLLAGGWSIALFVLQWSWNNLVDLVLERNPFVIGYFTIAGLISFGLCYYNGPVTNERGINLIQWTIQLIATYFIYKGVQPDALSVFVVIIVYIYSFLSSARVEGMLNLLPRNLISYKVRYYLFPPKTKLMTADEYEAEGLNETRKALLELREYCNSPDCDAWKVISRVRNPKRLSDFVTDGAHLTEEEYMSFEDNPFQYPKPEDDIDEDEQMDTY